MLGFSLAAEKGGLTRIDCTNAPSSAGCTPRVVGRVAPFRVSELFLGKGALVSVSVLCCLVAAYLCCASAAARTRSDDVVVFATLDLSRLGPFVAAAVAGGMAGLAVAAMTILIAVACGIGGVIHGVNAFAGLSFWTIARPSCLAGLWSAITGFWAWVAAYNARQSTGVTSMLVFGWLVVAGTVLVTGWSVARGLAASSVLLNGVLSGGPISWLISGVYPGVDTLSGGTQSTLPYRGVGLMIFFFLSIGVCLVGPVWRTWRDTPT